VTIGEALFKPFNFSSIEPSPHAATKDFEQCLFFGGAEDRPRGKGGGTYGIDMSISYAMVLLSVSESLS